MAHGVTAWRTAQPCRQLSHVEPAIDRVIGAVDIGSLIRSKPGTQAGNFDGFAEPAHWHRSGQAVEHIRWKAADRGAGDIARRDGVDGDPARGDFLRQGATESVHRRLGGSEIDLPIWPLCALTEPILTTRPQPRDVMPSTTCLVMLNNECRLLAITAFQSSRVICRNKVSRLPPALFTNTSISPTSALTLANAATVESQSAALPSDATKSKPSSRCSRSHASLRGELGPQPATTVCPLRASFWQIAVPTLPMPLVTYAMRRVIA